MIRLARIAAICFAVLAALSAHVAPDRAHAGSQPYNQSSHPPEFFRDLLGGRVFVYEFNGMPAARYHARDGSVIPCWYSHRQQRYVRTSSTSSSWRIGTPAGPSNLEMRWTTSADKQRYLRRVIIYTPDTGAFHLERFSGNTRRWSATLRGWIQETWPKVLLDECPHLGLPHDLPVDDYQDSLSFEHMKANANPVRNHPGSDRGYPGATGIGAAGNGPTLTPQDYDSAIRAFHGLVSRTNRGRRVVFNILPDSREAWLLYDDDDIRDTGTVSYTQNGALLTTDWHLSGLRHSLHVGYPIPAVSTGALHPAFAMMNDLASSGRPVAIAAGSDEAVPHVFRADHTVHAAGGAGTWRISRGAIHFDAGGETLSFPWREFAEIAGWNKSKGNYTEN